MAGKADAAAVARVVFCRKLRRESADSEDIGRGFRVKAPSLFGGGKYYLKE
jgi:hypothetical protein